MKLLHIAHGYEYNGRMLSPYMLKELNQFGELTLLARGDRMTDDEKLRHIRGCDVLLTGWGSASVPDRITEDRGRLGYILNITGEMRRWISPLIIASGIPVTNWGDAQAASVAEGAMALLLTVLKNVRVIGKRVEAGVWGGNDLPQGSLTGLRVGVYGMGVIAQAFIRYILPYEPVLTGYDPYVSCQDWPASVSRADSLESLFESIDCLVVHAGLSPETRHSVTAELLQKLPDNGVVINTARGGIIDQAALMAELYTGRLRAGLDVLDSPEAGDTLLINDPARLYPNLVLTCHIAGDDRWARGEAPELFHQIALDNLKRFTENRPLRFIMDEARYARST